jgi:hypothetical protein
MNTSLVVSRNLVAASGAAARGPHARDDAPGPQAFFNSDVMTRKRQSALRLLGTGRYASP